MSGHKLELIRKPDGGAYLNYWDWMNGRDTLWEITPDGKVYNTRVLGSETTGQAELGTDLLRLLDAIERQLRQLGVDK